MRKGNLIILVICQLISASGSIVIVSLGGIIGTQLAANQAWATLPVSMMVIAVALTTIPAAMLMRRIGRGRGFAVGSLSAAVALGVVFLALKQQSFTLFVLAAMLFGINMAFTQQYRYAAAECVDKRWVPRAISFVLLGSIGGAILGPELVNRGQSWLSETTYGGTMLALVGLYVLQSLLFLRLQSVVDNEDSAEVKEERVLSQIVRQPLYIAAVIGGTAGYGLMTLVMTATPMSMHINDGFSLAETTSVIRAHVLGMYIPSLFSGFLIEFFGTIRLMLAGAVLLLITSIVGLQGHALHHYWWALVLLGVGWNFLYVGGTTMLTYTYSLSERFRAQAVNEFLVFGASATASLLAGTVMHYFGWFRLMLVPIPLLIIVALVLYGVRNDALLPTNGAAQ